MYYGVTRYSLFSPGSLSWKTSGGGVFPTPDAYMHYLFSEERLDLRADIFLLRSVPALAKMAEGHDYKHFVLYSALLPKRHQDLLFEAAARYPFLVPVEWNEVVNGSGIEEVHPLIEADLATRTAPDAGLEPVVWFRLDDDDILAVDYLARLESYRTLDHVGMAISFGLGLTAYKVDGGLVNLREFHHPKSAQGLAFVVAFDASAGRLSVTIPGPHHDVDQVMPTILDSREAMFFQIRHGDQDSTLQAKPDQRAVASLARLEKLPAVHAADVVAARWPSLIADLRRGDPDAHELPPPGAAPLRLTEETALRFPLDTQGRLDTQGGAGLVEFEFRFESDLDLDGAFAMVSYEFYDPESVDAEALGLMRSRTFGLCRQAWSRSSSGTIRQCVFLPEGVGLSGVVLRGKHAQPADVFVRVRPPRIIGLHKRA